MDLIQSNENSYRCLKGLGRLVSSSLDFEGRSPDDCCTSASMSRQPSVAGLFVLCLLDFSAYLLGNGQIFRIFFAFFYFFHSLSINSKSHLRLVFLSLTNYFYSSDSFGFKKIIIYFTIDLI